MDGGAYDGGVIGAGETGFAVWVTIHLVCMHTS